MMVRWLELLKNEKAPDTHATKPTKPPQGAEKASFVGFVAHPTWDFSKLGVTDTAGTQPTTPTDESGQRPEVSHPQDPKLTERVRLEASNKAQATQPNPDCHCWPHTAAMNTAEIELFMRRQAHFVRVGVSNADAERLADAWVTEDREGTNRGCCVACAHLSGFGRLRCSRASAAGVHPELAAEFARVLQRCNAFEPHWALENSEISQMISDVPEDQEA